MKRLINYLTVLLTVFGIGAWLGILAISLKLNPPAMYAKPSQLSPLLLVVAVLGLAAFVIALVLDRKDADRHAANRRTDGETTVYVRSLSDEGELHKVVEQANRMYDWLSGNDHPQPTRLIINGRLEEFRNVDEYFRRSLADLLARGGNRFQVEFKKDKS